MPLIPMYNEDSYTALEARNYLEKTGFGISQSGPNYKIFDGKNDPYKQHPIGIVSEEFLMALAQEDKTIEEYIDYVEAVKKMR